MVRDVQTTLMRSLQIQRTDWPARWAAEWFRGGAKYTGRWNIWPLGSDPSLLQAKESWGVSGVMLIFAAPDPFLLSGEYLKPWCITGLWILQAGSTKSGQADVLASFIQRFPFFPFHGYQWSLVQVRFCNISIILNIQEKKYSWACRLQPFFFKP